MTWSAVLDTAIGLSFTFLLIATFSAAVVEAISNLLRKRPKMLLRGLSALIAGAGGTPVTGKVQIAKNALTGSPERQLYKSTLAGTTKPTGDTAPTTVEQWTGAIMAHPLIEPMQNTTANNGKSRLPSYLPAQAVVGALLDLLLPDDAAQQKQDDFAAAVDAAIAEVAPAELRRALEALWRNADGDFIRFRTALEKWYDSQMDRVTGWYKRWSKRWVIVFTFVISLLFGVDSIHLAQRLYTDPATATAVADLATQELSTQAGTLCPPGTATTATPSATPSVTPAESPSATPAATPSATPAATQDPVEVVACVRTKMDEAAASGLPIGWPAGYVKDFWSFLLLVVGILITAGAATLGAPFWYDQLNRLGSLRNTGKKPTPTN